MRRMTTAVLGTIGLLAIAATALSVENSYWNLAGGQILVEVKTAGLKKIVATGPVEVASLGVLTDQVFVGHGSLSFTSNVTQTPIEYNPGTSRFEPASFSQTTAKFGVDFDEEPSGIDFPQVTRDFTDNLLTQVALLPVNIVPQNLSTNTADTFQGIELFEPTMKASGKCTAFKDFTMIKGSFQITAKGLRFIEGDTKTLGRKTTIKIREIIRGIRD